MAIWVNLVRHSCMASQYVPCADEVSGVGGDMRWGRAKEPCGTARLLTLEGALRSRIMVCPRSQSNAVLHSITRPQKMTHNAINIV